jgi:tRNA-dihydrouridine synthase B
MVLKMHSFKIGNVKIKNKSVLAPMLEYTTLPFRLLCKDFGCALTYSEMVHTNQIVSLKNDLNKINAIRSCSIDKPTTIQLVGNLYNKKEIISAIEIIDSYKYFDIIDFNLGCPSNRIISGNSGSSLLKDIDSILPIIKEINSITKKPFTIKTRLGFSKNNISKISTKLINCGISALAIHARKAIDNYSVPSDYKSVEIVAKNNNLPIIYNGDVTLDNLEDFISNKHFSAIMIARSALSNPSIFKNIKLNKYNTNFKNVSEIITKFNIYEKKYNIKFNYKKILFLSLISNFKNSSKIRNQISNCKNNNELDLIINNLDLI